MNYHEALQYLNSFVDYEKADNYDYESALKLDRMRKLSALLGDPHKGIRSIHVAGTKGKGSTAAIIHSILKSAGFRTGLYTSPHLISFRERIRINDALISEEDLAYFAEKVKTVTDVLQGDERPSFFEVYTAIAYLYLRQNAVDIAVYEVGLGGRLDATNIIEPLVSAITPLSYEHVQKLGTTLAEIASEKCGIIKPAVPCVSAPQDPEALAVIEKTCAERKANLILVGRDIKFKELGCDDKTNRFDVKGLTGDYANLGSGLLGSHQVINVATAIGAVESLLGRGIVIPEAAIRKGIKEARWSGRLEVASREPLTVLDGAQNRASACALASSVEKIFKFRKLILVLGVSKDKDIDGMLEELLPASDTIILTKSKVAERAMEPARIREHIKNGRGVVITGSVEEALKRAFSKAAVDDLVLVTGSLFVVGEAKEFLAKHSSAHPAGARHA
jgi:dihydrofolate synthase/folylpolyglutamate synthase